MVDCPCTKATGSVSGRQGWPTVAGMSFQLSRPTVVLGRALTLIEVLVVLVLVGVLTAVVWSALARPTADAQREMVETTLRSIAMEARQQARQSEGAPPAVFLEGAVAQVPVPVAELGGDDDVNRFRLAADESSGTVTMVRYGRCAVMVLGERVDDPERIEECDAGDPSMGASG